MRALVLLCGALLSIAVPAAVLVVGGGTETEPAALPDAGDSPRQALGQPKASAVARIASETQTHLVASTVCGRVVNDDGEPLPGAIVVMNASQHRAVCGVDGRFTLTVLVNDPCAWLEITHEGTAGLRRPLTLWPEARLDVGDLVLRLEARIGGTVVDPDGRPMAVAEVMTHGGRTAVTNGDGAFALGGLSAGRYVLVACTAGYCGRPSSTIELRAGETVEDVELHLERSRFLSGRVVDDGGAPIAGASLEARLADAEAVLPAIGVVSNAAGEFEVGPLPSGTVEVVVRHPAFLPFGRKYPTDTRDVDITMTSARAVFGRVLDEKSGEPVPIHRVSLLVSSLGEEGPWRCLGEPFVVMEGDAAAGRFRLPLGIHTIARVVVLSEEYAPALSEPFWMGRESVGPLDLSASQGARLRVELRGVRSC